MSKKGALPSVVLLVIAVAGTAILTLGATTSAYAAPPSGATPGHSEGHGTPRQDPGAPVLDGEDTGGEVDPNCWGDVSKQLAQAPDGQAGLGHHASSFGEPRDGVGNQAEDTPAEHGDIVGNMNQPEPINCIID